MTSKTQLGAMFAAIAGLGEDDRAIPYEGGTGVAGHDFLSGENRAKTWAEHQPHSRGHDDEPGQRKVRLQ